MTNGEVIREKLRGTILENLTDADIADWYGEQSLACQNCRIQTFCDTADSALTCPMVTFMWLGKEKDGE